MTSVTELITRVAGGEQLNRDEQDFLSASLREWEVQNQFWSAHMGAIGKPDFKELRIGRNRLGRRGLTIYNSGAIEDTVGKDGITLINTLADPLVGFLVYRDSAVGDLVLGIRDPENRTTTATQMTIGNTNEGRFLWFLKNHSAMVLGKDSNQDVELSISGGVDGEGRLKVISADDIAFIVIDGTDGSYLDIKDATAPSTPASGYGRIYVNSDTLYFLDDGGAAHNLQDGNIVASTFDKTSWTNTTAWNTVFEWTIPAGTMGANTGYLLNWYGYFNQNTGSNRTLYTRIDVNGTQLPNSTGVSDTVGSAANDRRYPVEVVFQNSGSVSSQDIFATIEVLNDTPTGGTTSINSSTTDITVKLQMKMSIASSSFHIDRRAALVSGPHG